MALGEEERKIEQEDERVASHSWVIVWFASMFASIGLTVWFFLLQ